MDTKKNELHSLLHWLLPHTVHKLNIKFYNCCIVFLTTRPSVGLIINHLRKFMVPKSTLFPQLKMKMHKTE